jgi:chemotaxis protein MotA
MIVKLIGALVFACSLGQLYYFEQVIAYSGLKIIFWPAILLTLLGPIGLIFLCSDSEQIRSLLTFLFKDSLHRSRRQLDSEYVMLKQLGAEYYQRGARAFDVRDRDVSAPVLKTIERLAIRIPLNDAYDILERDRDLLAAHLSQTVSLSTLGGRLAPSVGMLGTIIGMSQLLGHLKEPENIGSSMSVALLTTFYGLFFSLVLWTPVQQHLQRLLDLKMRSFEQALHWLELLQQRKPSDYFVDDGKRKTQTAPTVEAST